MSRPPDSIRLPNSWQIFGHPSYQVCSFLVHFEQDEFYLENYSFEQDEFFSSDFEYGYYELQEVTDYSQLESMILDYKKKFDKVSYFIDFARMTPTIIRYKRI